MFMQMIEVEVIIICRQEEKILHFHRSSPGGEK